jgi:DNA-binding SARP family transcriptional activator
MARGSERTLADVAALTAAEALRLPLAVFAETVEAADDGAVASQPAALLHLARALEPGQRLARRNAALDRLEGLVAPDSVLGREAAAERAIDGARAGELDGPEQLARHILANVAPTEPVAHARASEALGRVLAWRGDEMSSRAAARIMSEVAQEYAALGCVEWQGYVLFWRANSVFYQRGDLISAEAGMRAGLDLLTASSPRRGVVLTFLSEILTMRGEWVDVDEILDEAADLAARYDDSATRAYVTWQRARIASIKDDADGVERYLDETERHRADWFDITSGSTYLADAAELMDRVGRHTAADDYLRRAVERNPDDEFVLQAQASVLARRGDPHAALVALRALTHAPWLEVRLTWRRTLLTAYASMRAGREDAGTLAARALEQAAELGDARIALIGEPALMTTLLPLAAGSGSALAERLLSPDGLVVRLFGRFVVHRDGEPVDLPGGASSEIVRLLALDAGGLGVEEVVDALWPDVDLEEGRRRLRGVLSRLRTRSGDLVVRDGTRLLLTDAWVDARAFREAADRALAGVAADRAGLAVAALALWTGELLPADPYQSWAVGPRVQLRRRRIELLDVVAAAAAERGSLDEARYALEQAIEVDPYDESRYLRVAEHLIALGRREPAVRVLRRALAMLAELGVEPPPELRRLMVEADRN